MATRWVCQGCGVSIVIALGWLLDVPTAQAEILLSTDQLASLSGYVYCDLNNDGMRDPKERGIGGVKLLLKRFLEESEGNEADTDTIVTLKTDNLGAYTFENLPVLAGLYYSLTEEQPEKYVQGKTSIGGIVVAGTDRIEGITLTAGQQAVEYNFGEWGLKIQYISKRLLIVPEPSSIMAMAMGALALAGLRRLRRRSW